MEYGKFERVMEIISGKEREMEEERERARRRRRRQPAGSSGLS